MLDSRKGEALLAVIDSGSFEQAAVRLHLTPSAVSQRVSAMESELGMPLIIRSKPCRATAAGQRLVQYLRRSRLLEDEFLADSGDGPARPLSVALAVNNDTLATWLLPGLAPFLIAEHILLDILLDDQDHTYTLLSQGLALAGVSSQAEPMRGCEVQMLGAMRYRLLAAPAFAQTWFPHGLQRDAARVAPLMTFDRKDTLQSGFLLRELGLPPGSYPSHYMPASDAFMNAIRHGLGYGMVPELQYGKLVEAGELIDLAPDKPTDIMLYWHAWRVQSPKLERLSAQVVAAARAVLIQVPSLDQTRIGN
ncbi:HTH-type transcriptional regulator ArgP [Massilia sp. CF038]|uniref:HTH-type transcriptional regulator ArgP n=1 Tax=Massilia sp. CF038 TaxID=1881045 RepID=UPI00091A8D65|nr:HTH-type transcriptional regulator ArgP [Massilia sp. CF038]SHH09583.1 LysR family transcriptional regulator, chromosome initiation inhibitor [Massilia sp. CF038]